MRTRRRERARFSRLLNRRGVAWLALLPAMLYLFVFFIIPIGQMVVRSFSEPTPGVGNYLRLVTQPVYFRVLLNTFRMALIVAVVCVSLGYPYAVLLTRSGRTTRRVLLLIAVMPLWTSILVRSYAWLVLLQRNGLVNRMLVELSISSQPLPLVYNMLGVLLSMVYVLLPLAILVLYSAFFQIDRGLLDVASTLGASRVETFLRIYLPLSTPGVVAAFSLVFIVALGYFITPALLGGRNETMLAMLIEVQTNRLLDWGFSSALGVYLLIATFIFLGSLSKLLERMAPGKLGLQ